MDTMSAKAWGRWFRITDVEELMPRFTSMITDYIDGPRGDDAARFEQLESLLSSYEQEAWGAPLLEKQIAKSVDAVAGVYQQVRDRKITNREEQREAHERALRPLRVLPGNALLRGHILDALIRTRSEISDRTRRDRSGGGSRETAKVVVGQLRRQLFGRRAMIQGVSEYGTVVGRDAIDGICNRAKKCRKRPSNFDTFRAVARLLIDSFLGGLLDDDLLQGVHDAVFGAIETQAERDVDNWDGAPPKSWNAYVSRKSRVS